MILQDIVKRINKLISNNSSYNLNFDKLEFYIDTAVDHINLTLKENFKTPREYFDSNFVDEVISYSDKFIGSFDSPEDIPFEVNEDNYIFYNSGHCCDAETGYYISSGDSWVLVDELSDLSGIVSFNDMDINSYLDKFNYTEIPDRYIRRCVVYFAASFYLEEEDELESQYAVYKDRAEQSLAEWQQMDYSVFDITESNRRFL